MTIQLEYINNLLQTLPIMLALCLINAFSVIYYAIIICWSLPWSFTSSNYIATFTASSTVLGDNIDKKDN